MTNKHKLPELPYDLDALEPFISEKTLSYHYGKHHAAYVEKLNNAIEGTEFEGKTLEEIIIQAKGGIFNNAAQAWNHAFYWQCLAPQGEENTDSPICRIIERDFGSLSDFKKQFNEKALTLFGSGWTWLVLNKQGKLEIVNTLNADTPLTMGLHPLLTCDVWEHAYYLDYQNVRGEYLEGFWNLVNWEFVSQQYLELEQLQEMTDLDDKVIA